MSETSLIISDKQVNRRGMMLYTLNLSTFWLFCLLKHLNNLALGVFRNKYATINAFLMVVRINKTIIKSIIGYFGLI